MFALIRDVERLTFAEINFRIPKITRATIFVLPKKKITHER